MWCACLSETPRAQPLTLSVRSPAATVSASVTNCAAKAHSPRRPFDPHTRTSSPSAAMATSSPPYVCGAILEVHSRPLPRGRQSRLPENRSYQRGVFPLNSVGPTRGGICRRPCRVTIKKPPCPDIFSRTATLTQARRALNWQKQRRSVGKKTGLDTRFLLLNRIRVGVDLMDACFVRP